MVLICICVSKPDVCQSELINTLHSLVTHALWQVAAFKCVRFMQLF